MNIGIVCYPTYGGSGVVATELGMALAQKGKRVHFITYDRPVRLSRYAPNVFYHQVTPERYPLFEFVPYESALASTIVETAIYEKLDVLHAHYAVPHASSAVMAREILKARGFRLPVVTTLHGTDITLVGRVRSYEPVVSYSINNSDAVTSVSDYLRQATYAHFNVSEKPIHVIPNFIDVERYKPDLGRAYKSSLCPDAAECLIAHVSNFRPVKRTQDVVIAFEKILARVPARLVMVGDGPQRAETAEVVRARGMQEHVIFLGSQDAVEEILPQADLFLFPSENESFGLAALEAMACGLPVIGSDTGGLPELVEHGRNGFLFPVGHADAMAGAALELLTNPVRLRAFSADARRRAEQFAQAAITPMYERVYESVVDGAAATQA